MIIGINDNLLEVCKEINSSQLTAPDTDYGCEYIPEEHRYAIIK